MIRYVIKRILLLIPVIIAVSFIVFALLELMPGTFVETLISGDMTQEDVAALRAMYNLDKSMLYRYGLYMFNLIKGDLGLSMKTGLPVFNTYIQRLPSTLILSFSAAIIGIALSIPMGIQAARKAGTLTDAAASTFSLIGMSMPTFWLGLLLMLLFSMRLQWLPVGGNMDGIKSLILPAVCSAMSLTALCARQTRSSMLDVLNADFLRTARAKGVPEKRVVRKHALGNALIPIITTIGSQISLMLAGSAVVEQVFAWPGVGRMLVEGVNSRDVPIILGCTIMTTILYVLVMLIVDLLYAFIDPRIKSQYMLKSRKRKATVQKSTNPDILTADDTPQTSPDPGILTVDASTHVNLDIETSKVMLAQTEGVSFESTQSGMPDVRFDRASDIVATQNENNELDDKSATAGFVKARYKKRTQMGEIWHRLVRNKSSLAGLIILGIVFLVAIISLFISYESITASDVVNRYSPPSWQYPFGTDNMGRNAFLRVIYGTRYSLVIGFGSVALSVLVGVSLGSIAGFYGGVIDNIIMRISDILASIPGLMLGMVIMVVLGMKLQNLIIAVGIAGITHFIRMSRASILTVKGNEYIEASRAIGFSDFRIIVTQVLPNGLSPIMVQTTISLGFAIMIAAALSFLGFGVAPPTPEWGALVSAGRETARTTPWLMTFPGLAIMITVLGFNLLGDGLRDALDPKLKK